MAKISSFKAMRASTRREFKWGEIMAATKNLSGEFVVGAGGSGKVYRAELAVGEIVAVKKLTSCHHEEDPFQEKSFLREIKALGKIRHRNLVKLLGICSGPSVNLLVYEFMENGSLWDWLHRSEVENEKKKKELSWEERLRIGVGLAKGVEYLHYDCKEKIIHRDIKSSNVLLDGNMEAHLGDFGLAKVVAEKRQNGGTVTGDSVGYTESASLVAGTFGYMAPELAYSMRATEKSDVYSMGIVLMELVTGKMPMDPSLGDGLGIVVWVRESLKLPAMEMEHLFDPMARLLAPDEGPAMAEVLEVALQCTVDAPTARPTSREVADRLARVEGKRVNAWKKGSSVSFV